MTLKAGEEPFAIPVGDAGFMPAAPRFCRVLLEAICSNEMVPGSERRTSNECVPLGEELVGRREDTLAAVGPTYSGGGGNIGEGSEMSEEGVGCVPRGEGCGK